ncbi:DUF4760 domain-containing protein [Actinoplanes sp. N902-109]|uniref:DUF4760 domain-containing protein n=1 Tax=Actinoplanes sp. (strain N902-109) TaxID=649831 RepID=UPI0003295CA3|nr:DUF4760 domain-containing protein [Actinoplanes sp. N902-109]AGL18828.1 hypothetical protein L083_5318 [Actinoplanes sp. N902-109]
MTASTLLSLSSLVVSVLALVVSGGVAVRQLVRMRHSNMLPVALDLFREFRTEQFRADMRYLVERLWTDWPPGGTGVLDLPDEPRARVVRVASYFNNVGVLVANGVVDERMVRGFMGQSVLRAWDRVAPFLRVERTRRSDPAYNAYFEHLAARSIAVPPVPGLEQVPEGWSYDVTPYVRPSQQP